MKNGIIFLGIFIIVIAAFGLFFVYKDSAKVSPTPTSVPSMEPNSPTSMDTKPSPTNDKTELINTINPTHDSAIGVTIQKISGNFATGGIGPSDGNGGGAVWYAVKIDGQWKEVWTGQSHISCKVVNQYDIPKDIYYDICSDEY